MLFDNILKKSSPVLFRPPFGNLHQSSPCKWFTCKENIACTTPSVFIIVSGRLTWRTGERTSGLGYKLFRRFIHADNGISWIPRTLVDIKNPLHVGNKITILLWGYYPRLLSPWFEFVFLRPSELPRAILHRYTEVQRLYQPIIGATIANNRSEVHCNLMQSIVLQNHHLFSFHRYARVSSLSGIPAAHLQ